MKRTDRGNGVIEGLFENKELYRVLIEQSDEALLFTFGSEIIDCSLRVLSMFGVSSKSEIIGKDLSVYNPEKQPDGSLSTKKIVQHISEISKQNTNKFNWTFRQPSGITFDTVLNANSFHFENHIYYKFSIQKLQHPEQKREWESKNLLENIIELIPLPLFVKNEEFIYTHCNQAFCEYIGKTRDEIIGSTVFQISETEKAKIYQRADLELFNSGESQNYESKVRFHDNTDHDVIFRKSVTTDVFGNKTGIVGIIEDITEFKKNKNELAKNELKYQKIFENVQDVFYRTDLNGIITEISPSIKRYSKYVHSDIIGRPIGEFYSNPEDREKMIQQIMKSGEVMDFEILLKGKDNQKVWSSVNAHFTFDDEGSVTGIEGTIRDLTERKNTEETLKLSLSLLQSTLEATSYGILVVSLSGKITSYNEKFKSMFNLPDEVLTTHSDSKAIDYILNQLTDPELFLNKIKYLYKNPLIESHDTLKLIDGKVLERFSFPQILDGNPIGRVWSFLDVTMKKSSEEQLQLMAQTLKSINETVCIGDLDNRIVFVNEAFIKTFGYSEAEIRGKDISIILPDEKAPQELDDLFLQTHSEGWKGETLAQKKNGSKFPVLISTKILKNEKNEILGVVVVSSDISERKEAELALQAKEAQLSTLVQTIPDLIWLKDSNGVFLACNKQFEQLLGATEAEIIGKTDYDFVKKELADFYRKNDKIAMKSAVPLSNEEELFFASDGHYAYMETIKTPMFNMKNELVGVLGIGRDITYRKQAEKRLQESELKYRNLFETMPDGVYRSTPEGKFLDVNPAMVKILGYKSKEELLAIDIKTQLYFNPEDREMMISNLSSEKLEIFPLKKKDGSAVWLEDHGWFVRGENEQILYHEGVSRDVTDRRNSEIQLQKYSEQLKELNASKDKFFSIIAHDLKNPFNSITGLSEIIKNEARNLDISTIAQYAGIINSTSVNTFRLLENLLDWASIQQSSMPFCPEPTLLKKITTEVIELMIEKANSKMIAIINYIPVNLIVFADVNMLQTILRNLISNALKFTPTNGKIEINVISNTNELVISVKDTGIGISEEDIQKLFTIGSNYSKHGTENESGTGLGLLLCKEFVEKHHGRIWVESQIGKGTIFYFSINQNLSIIN